MLRCTGMWLDVYVFVGSGGGTLQARLDHVKGMDGECGDCAGGEAGNGLDQRGGEARMVVSHKGGSNGIML